MHTDHSGVELLLTTEEPWPWCELKNRCIHIWVYVYTPYHTIIRTEKWATRVWSATCLCEIKCDARPQVANYSVILQKYELWSGKLHKLLDDICFRLDNKKSLPGSWSQMIGLYYLKLCLINKLDFLLLFVNTILHDAEFSRQRSPQYSGPCKYTEKNKRSLCWTSKGDQTSSGTDNHTAA